ncbi:DUF917 domain-containing protein [Pseudomonas citronellolis]|uniref:DUF917 domain-containing protein n=1 Tax=Pseudomonas citronellolis TaxID=53408 RepID=UPI0023E46006|nr:DUF917 domain-containing protein [Pseudomonas citronellolis]MDF3934538.1 DUF917 domain-containing protein [Pseudomonas citronellolis]
MIEFDSLSSQDLARGAMLLGTGGGGDPYIGELFLRRQLQRGRQPRLVPLDEIADEAFVVSVAGIGAPTVLVEQLLSESALERILEEAESLYERRIDALVCAEVGGANAMLPLAAGALGGRPVVDADGIGRAFPHIEMTTFGIHGCSASPALFCDDLGNLARLSAADNPTLERMARSLAATLGGSLYGALYPMTGAQLKCFAVPGSLSLALRIGRFIRESRTASADPVTALVGFLDALEPGRPARELFDGKIVDVRHETRDGFHWGQVLIEDRAGVAETVQVDIQNEFLRARQGGRTLALVPDLLCLLDSESAEPLAAEHLRYGMHVRLLAYAASPRLLGEAALAVVGPRRFGLGEDWAPFAGADAWEAGT